MIVIHQEGNIVQYATSFEDMADICEVTVDTFKAFYQEAESKNYLKIYEDDKYEIQFFMMNPEFAMHGRFIVESAIKLFGIEY